MERKKKTSEIWDDKPVINVQRGVKDTIDKKKLNELIEKLQDKQSKIVQAIAFIYSNVHS